MHYDKTCGCTQGLLLADYLKALLTGDNLPGDLAAQAATSPLLRAAINGNRARRHHLRQRVRQGRGQRHRRRRRPERLPVADAGASARAAGRPVKPNAPPPPVSSPDYGLSMFLWGQPTTTDRDLKIASGANFHWQKTLFQWRHDRGQGQGRLRLDRGRPRRQGQHGQRHQDHRPHRLPARLGAQGPGAQRPARQLPGLRRLHLGLRHALSPRLAVRHGRRDRGLERSQPQSRVGQPAHQPAAGGRLRPLPDAGVPGRPRGPAQHRHHHRRPVADGREDRRRLGRRRVPAVAVRRGSQGRRELRRPGRPRQHPGARGRRRAQLAAGLPATPASTSAASSSCATSRSKPATPTARSGCSSSAGRPTRSTPTSPGSPSPKTRRRTTSSRRSSTPRQHWSPWIGVMTLWTLADPTWTPADEKYWWAIDESRRHAARGAERGQDRTSGRGRSSTTSANQDGSPR